MRKVFLFSISLFGLLSCSDHWLDTSPSNGENAEQVLSNYKGLKSALTGVYDGLQGSRTQNSYYTARMFYYGDVRGDDMQSRVPGGRSSASYELNYTADNAPEIWSIPYDIVHRTNNIINAVDNNRITDGTEEEIGNIYAQAICCRSLAFFDLVRIYGMPYTFDNGKSLGVPLILKPISTQDEPARNTVAEVYSQVVNDLEKSIESGYLSSDKTMGYFNVWTAKALLARVYLYMNENEKALSVCEDIINNSPYTLWSRSEYLRAWEQQGTSEMIFEIVNFDIGDSAGNEGIAYDLREDGYADCIVTQTFTNLMNQDMDDIRQQLLLPAKNISYISIYGNEKVFINKFPGREGAGDVRINNLPIFRLSEIYLNASEAAMKLFDKTSDNGYKSKAVKFILPIVERANPITKEILNENTITLSRVLIERRKELFGEGHRFFDAMRNNEKIIRYTDEIAKGRHYTLIPQSQIFDRSYFRSLLPIPVSETEVNKNLKKQQNPGY